MKSRSLKNVTVTLDPEVARWARVRAAERDMSLSRFLAELLERERDDRSAYETAMNQYLEREPVTMREPGASLPGRDELHER
jgi:hypothetical protein